jgi:hypothetical protein
MSRLAKLSPAFRVIQLLKCATHRRHQVDAVLEGGKGAISGGQGSDPSLTGTFVRTRFSRKARPSGSGRPRILAAALHQLRGCWRNIRRYAPDGRSQLSSFCVRVLGASKAADGYLKKCAAFAVIELVEVRKSC